MAVTETHEERRTKMERDDWTLARIEMKRDGEVEREGEMERKEVEV